MQIHTHARLRSNLEAEIERLIAMLDDLEPDADLEEPGDLEPWLGWPEGGPSRLAKDMRVNDDREADLDGHAAYDANGRIQYETEDDKADNEPYLGAFENHPTPLGSNFCGQTAWANSAVYGDLECNLADAATDMEFCSGDYDGPGLIAGGQGL